MSTAEGASTTLETTVPEPERRELLHGSAELVAQVQHLEITNGESLEIAGQYRRQAKERLATIEQKVGKRVSAVYDAWRSLKDMQNELERPWNAIVSICGQLIGNYELRQRREAAARQEAQRQQRVAAEQEAARRHREELDRARAEAERQRMEDAAALFEAGDIDGADAALQHPTRPATVLAPQPTILPPLEKAEPVRASGTSVAVVHKARLLNLDQLIEAAYADKTLRCLLAFNEKAANGMAKAMGERMNVPGVEVFEAPNVRQR